MTATVPMPLQPRISLGAAGSPSSNAINYPKTYYELGWDFAAYAVGIPGDAPADMRGGWQDARARLRARPPSRAVRKWLNLRYGALRRHRMVDASVTPELIDFITPEICPVTLEALTFATHADTDWSVDRVANCGGYARSNLAIVSVRANRAKGAKDIHEVLALGRRLMAAGGAEQGLDGREWMRLAALMAGPSSIAEHRPFLVPQCTTLPVALAAGAAQIMQRVLLNEVLGQAPTSLLGRLREAGGQASAKRLHGFVQSMRHKAWRTAYAYDVWLEPGVFDRFVGWLHSLTAGQAQAAFSLMRRRYGCWKESVTAEEAAQAWGLETGGYALEAA